MRSELVFTHYTCNQNCSYCTVRRAADDPLHIRGAAVRGRIDTAVARGATEVVLTGGEPGMRNDLPSLVAHARARGAASVVLETNATLIDPARASSLAAAGLGRARVNLSGFGDALDEITRDPGGFSRTLDGLGALCDAGIPVEIVMVLVRRTLPLAAELPTKLHAWLSARASSSSAVPPLSMLAGLSLRVPTDSPDEEELVSYEEAAPVIVALEAAARAVGVPLKLAPDAAPPPCVFPAGARVAHLYALTPGGARRDDHRQLAACQGCQVADRCQGLSVAYLARNPVPAMRPVTEDRARRRLSLIASVEEQVAREFVQTNHVEQPGMPAVEERLIRVNFHCNQSCRFCFVSTHLPPPADAAVRRAIVEAGASGAKIVLTGGEPTLNANLVEYVRLAKAHSALPIHLQSNAVRCGDPEYVRALVDAGLGEAFISLHGVTAEVSDAVTEAPGTFEKTVVGIDRLHEAGLMLILNFVICERNLHQLPDYVRFVAARWPRAWVNISFVAASSDVVPKERALVPRYGDALPPLGEALKEAQRLGTRVVGFESMCGIPLCLVPTGMEPYLALGDLPDQLGGGEFVRGPACSDCDLNKKCHGLRRGYFDLYGSDELRTIKAGKAGQADSSAPTLVT